MLQVRNKLSHAVLKLGRPSADPYRVELRQSREAFRQLAGLWHHDVTDEDWDHPDAKLQRSLDFTPYVILRFVGSAASDTKPLGTYDYKQCA